MLLDDHKRKPHNHGPNPNIFGATKLSAKTLIKQLTFSFANVQNNQKENISSLIQQNEHLAFQNQRFFKPFEHIDDIYPHIGAYGSSAHFANICNSGLDKKHEGTLYKLQSNDSSPVKSHCRDNLTRVAGFQLPLIRRPRTSRLTDEFYLKSMCFAAYGSTEGRILFHTIQFIVNNEFMM